MDSVHKIEQNRTEHKENAHNNGNRALPLNSFTNSAPHHKDVQWLHHRWYMGEHKSVQCY